MKITIQEASFHRNGVSGLGFYAVRFQWTPDDADKPENFIATLFDEAGACAVISLDRIKSHGIGFGRGNSWRGDHFEDELRRQIKQGAVTSGLRIGPFAIP